jgi:hypothetical protein
MEERYQAAEIVLSKKTRDEFLRQSPGGIREGHFKSWASRSIGVSRLNIDELGSRPYLAIEDR